MTNVSMFLSQYVVSLLRKIVQEIEHHIAIQVDHISNAFLSTCCHENQLM
jgi:hypothetical protein